MTASSTAASPSAGASAEPRMTTMPDLPRISRLTLALCVAFAGSATAAEFDCLIEPRQTIDIRPSTEGLIEQVLVDRGDRIRAGQTLVVLGSGVERALLEQARFRAASVGTLRSAQSRVEYAGIKLARREQLAGENFISTQDRDEARAEKTLAEAELVQAREAQRAAELEALRASEQLRLRTLKSPFNGIVVDRTAHPGDLADNRDIRKPLLRVADISVLYVEVLLPAEAYGQVKAGAAVDVLPDKPVGGRYPARVRTVDQLIDAASGTFRVRLELPNPEFKLPAGFGCRADFPGIARPGGGLAGRTRPAAPTPPAASPPR